MRCSAPSVDRDTKEKMALAIIRTAVISGMTYGMGEFNDRVWPKASYDAEGKNLAIVVAAATALEQLCEFAIFKVNKWYTNRHSAQGGSTGPTNSIYTAVPQDDPQGNGTVVTRTNGDENDNGSDDEALLGATSTPGVAGGHE